MPVEEIKDQITKYVQVIETNYTEVIRQLKDDANRQKVKVQKVIGVGINN